MDFKWCECGFASGSTWKGQSSGEPQRDDKPIAVPVGPDAAVLGKHRSVVSLVRFLRLFRRSVIWSVKLVGRPCTERIRRGRGNVGPSLSIAGFDGQ